MNLKLERWDDVIQNCDSALKLEEKSLKAYLRRAQALIKLGRISKANDDLKAALAIESDCKVSCEAICHDILRLARTASVSMIGQDAVRMLKEIELETKASSHESIQKQKKVFGSFWSSGAGAGGDAGAGARRAPERLYEDVGPRWAGTRCFMEFGFDGGESLGTVYFQLNNARCPRTAENFRCLCTGERGPELHYQGSLMHRVVKGFVVQASPSRAFIDQIEPSPPPPPPTLTRPSRGEVRRRRTAAGGGHSVQRRGGRG